MRRVGWVGVALCVAACGPKRVSIAPVTQPTTTAEALQLYAQYGVAGLRYENLVLGGPRALPTRLVEQNLDALVLNNGMEIEDPRDLIPVLPASSNAIGFANAWAAGRAKWTVPGAFASATSLLGFGGLIASGFTLNQVKSAGPTLVSLGLLIIGPIVSLAIGKVIAPDVGKLLVQAFQAYQIELEALQSFVPPANAPSGAAP